MRISEVRIERYRSIYDVRFHPASLSVLVGPNNSGKTNFLEALHFLSEVYQYDLETAIIRKGGVENIAHRRVRRTKSAVAFSSTAQLSVGDLRRSHLHGGRRPKLPKTHALQVRHTFGFSVAGQAIEADYTVSSESVELTYFDGRSQLQLFRLNRDRHGNLDKHITPAADWPRWISKWREQVIDPFEEDAYWDFVTRYLSPTSLIIEQMQFNDLVTAFLRGFAGTRLYQMTPLETRRPGVPTPNASLERHGSNLPALVAYMQRHQQATWARIFSAMQRVVPNLEDVRTDFTPDRLLTLQFVETGIGRPWTVEEVSDGTMQSLAIFAAIHDPRTPLLLIEEPENSVHPWIIRVFVEACRSAEHTQIVVSTHSPVLIDALAPADLSIVWRNNGRTQVRPLTEVEPDAHAMWEQGDVGIFDLIDTGLLPDAVPGRLT